MTDQPQADQDELTPDDTAQTTQPPPQQPVPQHTEPAAVPERAERSSSDPKTSRFDYGAIDVSHLSAFILGGTFSKPVSREKFEAELYPAVATVVRAGATLDQLLALLETYPPLVALGQKIPEDPIKKLIKAARKEEKALTEAKTGKEAEAARTAEAARLATEKQANRKAR